MRLSCIFLLCLFSAAFGAVPEDFTLELRDSGIGFNSTVDDYGSVSFMLRWIHLIGVVGDHGSFLCMLWEDRLESFLETRTAVGLISCYVRLM